MARVRDYDILTEEQLQRVHNESIRILKEIGVEFEYEPAVEVLKAHGCKVDGNRVFFDEDFIMARLAEAPSSFVLQARDPEKTLTCGNGSFILTPSYGPPFIYELDGSRRDSNMQDYDNFIKIVHNSQNINHTGGNVCEMNDLDDKFRVLRMTESHMKYSDKPFMGSARGAEGAEDSCKLASIMFGGDEAIAEKPVLNTLINSLTPLKFDERMLGAAMVHAKYGQSCMVSSLVMSGSTGPVTMAETIALQNAETLAGICLCECVRPGAPVIMGSTSGPCDMATMSLSIGNAEVALYTSATAQLARMYDIPARGGGGLNDAIASDAQAGFESMLTLLAAGQSGIAFVLHAAGIMHYYNAASYEKLIIDDEIAGLCNKFLAGYNFDEEQFLYDAVEAVGPGGHYLFEPSTRKFMRGLRRPLISNRGTYDSWIAEGKKSAAEVANAKWKQMLEDYEAPAMDPELEQAIDAYIDKRVEEMGGGDYPHIKL